MRKGIILAGGKGSRLYPMTSGVNKQLQSVYDKPMIYYPLATLMNAAIKDILIISSPDQLPLFKQMFRSGNQLGINIEYATQYKPKGLADAFLVGEKFIDGDPCALVLGDNIFYGDEFYKDLMYISKMNENCVFGYRVSNPSDYGVVDFEKPLDPYDLDVKVNSIEEKPDQPKSNYAVPGLYFYDNTVVDRVKNLQPSDRGELEITDLNNSYIQDNKLRVKLIKETAAWFDTGSPDQMFEAAMFVKSIQSRTGQMIACLEEIAFKRGFISGDHFRQRVLLAIPDGCDYKRYLMDKYEIRPLCAT
tara:strand:+ start:185 stop:1096 length:912 start_codon:yes stop_codon:yes gene_type:complete